MIKYYLIHASCVSPMRRLLPTPDIRFWLINDHTVGQTGLVQMQLLLTQHRSQSRHVMLFVAEVIAKPVIKTVPCLELRRFSRCGESEQLNEHLGRYKSGTGPIKGLVASRRWYAHFSQVDRQITWGSIRSKLPEDFIDETAMIACVICKMYDDFELGHTARTATNEFK